MSDSPDLQRLARDGDQEALATLINQALRKYQVTATLERQGDRLSIWLSGAEVPSKKLAKILRQGLIKLQIPNLVTLKISSHKNGEPKPVWSGSTKLVQNPPATPAPPQNFSTSPNPPITPPTPSISNVSGTVEQEPNITLPPTPPETKDQEEEIPIPLPSRSPQERSVYIMGRPTQSTGVGKFPISVEWFIAHILAIPVLFMLFRIVDFSRDSIIESLLLGTIFGAIQTMVVARRIRLTWAWGLITLGSFVLFRPEFGQGCLFLAGIAQWTLLQKQWSTGYYWLVFNILGFISSLSSGLAVFWDFDGFAMIFDFIFMVNYAITFGMVLEIALENHRDRLSVKLWNFSGLFQSFWRRLQTINPNSAAHRIPLEEPRVSLVSVICSKWVIACAMTVLITILIAIPLSLLSAFPIVGVFVAAILLLGIFTTLIGRFQQNVLKGYLGEIATKGWAKNTDGGFMLMPVWFIGSSVALGFVLPDRFIQSAGLAIACIQFVIWGIGGGLLGLYQGSVFRALDRGSINSPFLNKPLQLWVITNAMSFGISGFAMTLFDISAQFGITLQTLIVTSVTTIIATIIYPLSTGIVAGLIVAKHVEATLAGAK